jgi:NTP pyrophosphohydrolases including oxidative damage repair enzymes
MIIINNKSDKEVNSKRNSSYGILENELGQIAVVRHSGWGLIFPGGKIEENESSDDTIIRETLEEIGHEVSNLKYYDTTESFYDVTVKGEEFYCHNIADFYTGNILDKIKDPTELDTVLEWYYPADLFNKMKLEFQNIILEKIYNNK